MKTVRMFSMMAAVLSFAAAQERKADVLLQAGMVRETVQGDLKGAIQLYENAFKQAGTDRALAAKALLKIAQCYEKMGNAESRKAYERLVREYSDQKDAAALARVRLGGSSQSGRQSSTLVWSAPNTGIRGRVSADGRYLAYTDWNTEDLAVRDIAAGTDRRLTDNHKRGKSDNAGMTEGAAISRDGKHVIYNYLDYKSDRVELRVASLVGDPNSRRLYDSPEINWFRPWDWSPDGKRVSVEIWRTDGTQQIGLISFPDGSLRVLKSVDWRGGAGLFFSPDGKYLAYDLPQKDTGSERDVFVLAVDGSREIHTVAHPSNDVTMGWSPDGKWLLFTSDRRGSTDLWGQPFTDAKPQGAAELLRPNIPVAPQTEPMGITNSGTLYYGTRNSQDRFKIQLADFDFTTGKVSGVADLISDYFESNALPEWSPDGRQLAYKSIRGPAQRPTHEVVVIRSIDTGQSREMRPNLSYFGPMRWAPDGSSFLTLGRDFRGHTGIYRIDPVNGDASALIVDKPGERSFYPVWAPDGKRFYLRRDYPATKDSAYIQYDLSTRSETELIRRRVLSQVDMSPDGRYFASRSVDEPSNSRTLLLISTAGGNVRELVRYPSALPPQDLTDARKGLWLGQGPWAPDSLSFIANKTRNVAEAFVKPVETWRIPIDGAAPRKLEGSFPGAPWSVRHDGRIAYTTREITSPRQPEIWALENFLPATIK